MSTIPNKECEMKSLKTNELDDEKDKNELRDEIKRISYELNEKMIENEKYQQQLHELKHTLKASLATQKDLMDANESMEENMLTQQKATERKINNILEKFSVEKKKYEEKFNELQNNIEREEKKNDELRETITAKEKLFTSMRFEDPDRTQENFILKDQIKDLIQNLEEKEKIEKELLSKQQHLEETLLNLQKNYNEVCDILQVKKADLQSLNEILETTRDDLFLCRSELESLKAAPANDCIRGNSLFAEVEDNRQKMINDMHSLKQKYLHMKQTYEAKENEIRLLKGERAALLRRWDEDTLQTIDHSARLIETYKSRISKLENKIKMDEKKQKFKDTSREQPSENNFCYLQSLLTAKKKEIEELYNKLEENSTQKVLQEEMQYEVEKQLRKWKCKAMSYQAQLLAIQNQTKCEEYLTIKPKDTGDADLAVNTEESEPPSTITTMSSSQGTDNFDATLHELLQVPEIVSQKECGMIAHCLSSDLDTSGEHSSVIQIEKTVYMDETIPICSRQSSDMKPISDHESDKENTASTSNDNKVLKSVLLKSVNSVQEKSKKSLRFATDTIDHEKPKPVRQKIEKQAYPVVFISNQSSR